LAAAYIRGVQRYGIGACVKHYVANESETQRRTVNVRVSEAALRELYLLPFEICVADAHPWTIMAAYNDVNGVAATEQDELNNGVLKSEWGWDGLLMSDWGATKTAAPAANGGLDLVMPGPAGPWGDQLVAAVRSGAVAAAAIDDHLTRLLRLAGRVGAVQGIPAEQTAELGPLIEPASASMRLSLRNLATAGMVLLKGQEILPLTDSPITDDSPLVLIGRHALETTLQGGGSAAVRPPHQISIAEGLAEALGASRVKVLDGVAVRHNPTAANPESIIDPQTGRPGMRITSFDSSGAELASTSSEVAEFLLGMTSGPHEGASFLENVLWIGLPGQEGGDAVADGLLGKAEPTGRLVTTFPVADGDGPAWNVTPQDGALDYAEGTRVGYRGWYGSEVEPAFWFGAGLGWGVWDYRSAEQLRDGDGESVTVILANTAERPSTEVVQVYWRPEAAAPVRLVGYSVADEIVPGEERTVTVACDRRAFRLWNEAASGWEAPSGGTFLIARGLGNIRLDVPRS